MIKPEPKLNTKDLSGFKLLNRSIRLSALVLLGLSIYTSQVYCQAVQTEIRDRIGTLIQNSAAPNAIWSVSVTNSSGVPILSINDQVYVRPASNLKILTSAAVLDALGAHFTFQTIIFGNGELKNGVWYGDLIIKGSGDPSIDEYLYNGDKLFVMNKLADQIYQYGIRSIEGKLLAEVSIFDDQPYPKGWEWDDLTYYYSPKISPLSFNGNVVNLEVRATGGVGSKPEISWFPFNTDYVEFVNEQIITARNIPYNESYNRLPGSNKIVLRSTLPLGYVEKEPLTVPNPELYFLDVFRRVLSSKGVDVKGGNHIAETGIDDNENQRIALHESESLAKLIKRVNSDSDNFYTEMLLKSAVYYSLNQKGSTITGTRLVNDFIQKMQIDTTQFYLKDGSGLASFNLVTTSGMAHFLFAMRTHDHYDSFLRSLATVDQNANLRGRFRNSSAGPFLNVKTGYISGVRALSGYLLTKSGQSVSFSIITNNYPVRTVFIDQIHHSIIDLIYENL